MKIHVVTNNCTIINFSCIWQNHTSTKGSDRTLNINFSIRISFDYKMRINKHSFITYVYLVPNKWKRYYKNATCQANSLTKYMKVFLICLLKLSIQIKDLVWKGNINYYTRHIDKMILHQTGNVNDKK